MTFNTFLHGMMLAISHVQAFSPPVCKQKNLLPCLHAMQHLAEAIRAFILRIFTPCRQRKEAVNAFFGADGPSALTWFYQVPSGKPAGSPVQLYLGSPQVCTRLKYT